MYNRKQSGFTLIELLVVIAIIELISSVILASLNTARIKARNAKRLQTIRQVQLALEYYYDQYGRYPPPISDTGVNDCGGWDATVDGVFISSLATNGYLKTTINDPGFDTNCGNYSYYRYSAGDYSCPASGGAFYILGVRNMEGGAIYPGSPGFNCSGRNWQDEFQWVTGKYEN